MIGRTVYRIVQEGMTNAAKHAPGTSPHRGQRVPRRGCDVELRNPLGLRAGSTPGAGLGLVGLTERTELRGGRLEDAARKAPGCCAAGSRGRHDPPMISVLIVDDDPLVRSALELMLGGQPDVPVVGEAPDGQAGLAPRASCAPTSS